MKNFDLEGALRTLLQDSIRDIQKNYQIDNIPDFVIEIPKNHAFGDLSTNAAMLIGHQTKHPAHQIAIILVDKIKNRLKQSSLGSFVESVETKGPGFVNFRLKDTSLYYVLDEITRLKSTYGRSSVGKKQKLQIEFASANPTGPLTVAHGRQAAFGDSLANILAFSGYRVTREYYINDMGRQVNLLGESIKASYLDLIGEGNNFPEDGYKGRYVSDLASVLVKKFGTKKKSSPVEFFVNFGYRLLLKNIKKDLVSFGVKFDVWYSEKSLRRKGLIKKALHILKSKGLLYESENAVWFKSTQFGDEKDRVITKQDGQFTYLAPDIAYHMHKFRRGFKKVIDVWGPDHHGYIARVKAAVKGLGFNPEDLHCLLVQLVTLYHGSEVVRISKRTGKFVSLIDVINEVGKDVSRFFFLMRRRDSLLNFDLDLAKKESMDNPVYYIQYAHARICSITKFYKTEHGALNSIKLDKSLLKEKEEFRILRILREFPLVTRSCATSLETYPLIPYLQELAADFHGFYNKHRVVSENLALTRARVHLITCIGTVLSTGLKLLGVSHPAEM